MKRLIVLLTVLILVLPGCIGKKNMAIDFTEVDQQRVDFGATSGLPKVPFQDGNDLMSMVLIFEVDGFNAASPEISYILSVVDPNAVPVSWGMSVKLDDYYNTEAISFAYVGWDASPYNNDWSTPNNSLAVGGKYVVVITYDRALKANDPIIYINGTPQVLTQNVTANAAGNALLDDESVFALGGLATWATRKSLNGRVFYFAGFQNRILTQEEVSSITEQRSAKEFEPDFVIEPNGADGVQQFDGAVLAAGNVITEKISGYKGVPSGSPLGYAEDYLHAR